MTRCDLCPGKFSCVPPDGPVEADYLFIGEAPGKDEDKQLRPFVGKTGREVNEHYLPLAGLRRGSVRFTNTIRCYPDRPQGRLDLGKLKDRALVESCATCHLYPELEETRPKLIIPMGALACHAIDPDINLELQHGIPLETAWGTVFPMYHPAGGLHEPKKMLLIRNDYVRLGKYIKGKLGISQDAYSNRTDYRHVGADELLETYLECNDYTGAMACDTEITRFREPYCLTFSTAPGTGRLILAEDTDALKIFQCILDKWAGPILFHNWLFDRSVTEGLGIRIRSELVVDTMVRCFHLGNLPQGLKALAYRLLGMEMMDFDDLVTPYSTPLCLEYLRKAMDIEWPKPEEQLVREADGSWKLYKPQSMSTKLKRFLTDYTKNPDKDVYKSWDNWESDHQQIESVLGQWPGKDIRYAPFDKQVYYACRDADATLRLWTILESMRRQVRRKLPEHWE